MNTIIVDAQGTELAYLDSGPPSSTPYTTLFAIHGMVFASHVWDKIMALAPKHGLRIVAVNRRGYPGSTPFSPNEINIIQTGSDKEKEALPRTISVQVAMFIDLFTQRNRLPPLSADGKVGGFGIVTWSMGCINGLGVAAHVGALPAEIQQRFCTNLQAIIMLEAPDSALGMEMAAQSYNILLDKAVPLDLRIPLWQTWITAYFKHGDLSKRDLNEVSFVVPWHIRAPSIYNMTEEQAAQITYTPCSWSFELPVLIHLGPQLNGIYKKACFDKSARGLLPRMKIWAVVGSRGVSFSINAFFNMQNDNDEHGGGDMNFEIAPGCNHFMHWDDPEVTIEILLSALAHA